MDDTEKLHKSHLQRASFCYQLNSHWKKFAIKSFKIRSIKVRRLKKGEDDPIDRKHQGTFAHYEVDFDVDHPECFNNLNMVYFKRKITVKSLNMIQHPPDELGTRKVFIWSAMHGGKQAEETIQCLEFCSNNRLLGATGCIVNLDGAL